MSERDWSGVETARRTLAEADASRRRALQAEAAGARRLRGLERELDARDRILVAARAEHERLAQEAARAADGVAAARRDLAGRLAGVFATGDADDAAQLDATLPIALFPVRVETRFDFQSAGAALLVRVYPDVVLADVHDPLLTAKERDEGFAYWRRAAAGEATAWRELVRQHRAPRAAWIVRVTTPVATAPDGAPEFPEVPLRPESWDRPPLAQLLPDRWLVVCLRDGVEVARGVSAPVAEPLALGPDPHFRPTDADSAPDALAIDPGMRWTVDFATALEAGMALRIPLAEEQARAGFERVLVLGLKASLAPEAAGAALGDLFERHRFGAGWALLPQGTPTSNTELVRSAYPPADAEGARSFAAERGAPLDVDEGDGVRFARAFGVERAVVAHVEGADRAEGLAAEGMAVALWPVAMGYFLRQMMAPHVGEPAIEAAREHFARFVRGRGPLPAFRVASQPYGVLPVTSLRRWQARAGARGFEVELPRILGRLRAFFDVQAASAPHVRPGGDPDADLLSVLAMDASSRVVRVRRAVGPDFRANLIAFLGIDGAAWESASAAIVTPVLGLVGHPELRPRLLGTSFDERAGRYRFPLVADGPLSEEAPLAFDYVAWVRGASIDDLRAERVEGGAPPNALLYRMLRHARLAELDRAAVELNIRLGAAAAITRLEPELVGIADASRDRPDAWRRLASPLAALTGSRSVGEFLASGAADVPEALPVRDHTAALARLEGLPSAELERLFTETLDTCSHRFDAWATSLATRRLEELRAQRPSGLHVGAYGWVEDLRPAPPGAPGETRADGRVVRLPQSKGGFVQTPSLDHAAAAAVLRNAYLTRGEGASDAYAVDLSSRRVRAALEVLDAVREGQALGAVFGYRFERGLQERGAARLIEPLRRRFPAVANALETSSASPEALAARGVVDGKALRDAWRAGSLDLAALGGVPPTAPERTAVEGELARLDEAVDAVADLLLAESVYQLVSGNTGAANASLDAMARGIPPPEPGIVRSPATGVPLTHRVAIVLGDGASLASGWSATATARAAAEPQLDAWAGRLLGDPGTVRFRAQVTAPDGVATERELSLAQLDLRPLDVVSLARDAAAAEQPAELESRCAAAALAGAPAGSTVQVVFARDPAWPRDSVRTVPEVLELAGGLAELFAAARPLAPADVSPAGDPAAGAAALEDDARQRASAARDGLEALTASLQQALLDDDAPAIAQRLAEASLYGLPGAFPRTGEDPRPRARAVARELARRGAAARTAGDGPAVARAVFGSGFLLLPRFVPPRAAELGQALAASAALVGDPALPLRWLHQSARVRPALARWRRVALLAQALDAPRGALDVVQLPFRPGARWIALPFAGEGPAAGALSLVLQREAAPAADAPWAGLVVDEWSERIPAREATTGLAFHFETPNAEAPHAVLLAVPPGLAARWSTADLLATLAETLDLAKARAVDGELLGRLGQLAPSVYLAANAAGDTISTDFRGAIADEVSAPTRARI